MDKMKRINNYLSTEPIKVVEENMTPPELTEYDQKFYAVMMEANRFRDQCNKMIEYYEYLEETYTPENICNYDSQWIDFIRNTFLKAIYSFSTSYGKFQECVLQYLDYVQDILTDKSIRTNYCWSCNRYSKSIENFGCCL